MYVLYAIIVVISYILFQSLSHQEKTWCKLRQAIAFCYLWLWKRKTGPMFGFELDMKEPRKFGMKPLPESNVRENPRTLSTDLNAMDCIRFCGTSGNGDVLMVGINRLHDRCSEVTIYLRLANGDEYQHPIHPGCRIYNTDGRSFSAAGLTFEVLEPLKRWRIYFNGQLKAISKTATDDILPVKFNFITQDKEWSEQFGEAHGTLQIDTGNEITIVFRGLKERIHGISNWNCLNGEISVTGVTDNGATFHLHETVDNSGLSILYGYVCAPCNTITRHIHQWSRNFISMANEDHIAISFKAGDRDYEMTLDYDNKAFEMFNGEDWDFQNRNRVFKSKLNGRDGYAVMETRAKWNGGNPFLRQRSLPQLIEPALDTTDKFVVTFKDIACHSSKIVGGKGSSLAMMSSLAHASWQHHQFQVPQGVCITNSAFSKHLKDNPALQHRIAILESIAWKQKEGSLVEECERTMNAITETDVSHTLQIQLNTTLHSIFGDGYKMLKFAVRSSAIGEDSEDLSAAGQNETFLGIQGIEEICSAIIKCWASQFSHRSTEYKRQNGQLLNGGMAVVVQQMVPADVAGVLFTNHPVTGSRAYMMIASNYGLGESVVSGTSDPDTILLLRNWDERLSIIEKQIGKKSIKITMSDGTGVVEESVSEEAASHCTVTDEVAIKLGRIAIYLENCWGTNRDIEWAIHGDDIFLLQSRPVTTHGTMSEFEVIHEFDAPFITDREHYSTANTGEVSPGALTPLSNSFILPITNTTLMKLMTWKLHRHRFDPTTNCDTITFYGHVFFDQIQEKLWSLAKTKTDISKAFEIGLYGRVLDDDYVLDIAVERADNPPWTAPFLMTKLMMTGLIFGKWISDNCRKKLFQYRTGEKNAKTVKEAYERTERNLKEIDKSITSHLRTSFGSMLWNVIILNMLTDSKEGISNAQYADFALLTSGANDTESGSVPLSLKELATAIANDIEPTKFVNMSVQEAIQWIKENTKNSQRKFEEFMERYGHRGYKECDLRCKTWRSQPQKLIKLMQNMLQNSVSHTETKTEQDTDPLQKIKTQISPFKKRIMALLLKAARCGIRQREITKSYVIKVIDEYRKDFHQLAQLMVANGMIIDEDLLYFLTQEEIDIVIRTRSAKILQRANRRRRLHEKMDTLEFPELIIGFPTPIDKTNGSVQVDNLSQISGYPVCQGKIQGPARVIHNFDQVHTIESGDILITHATDIGWTPYFPLLAGVVTELGGLISHGAVVAREFGLPCIVGATNATNIFKSGETVLLNATTGTISRVVS